jgi:DNA-binding GntR family transcriptional regulator
MATKRTAAIGKLASVTKAPRMAAKPPSISTSMVDHAIGSPIFLIERTSYSIGYRPVDYEKLHYRGDQIRFVTRLARRKPVSHKGTVRE